jgi:hypothetical protein
MSISTDVRSAKKYVLDCAAREAGSFTNLSPVPAVVEHVLHDVGRPLEQPIRSIMEERFGRPFGHVRIHDGQLPAESARAVNALAYSAGEHIVFAAGEYDVSRRRGILLLAHELAHVAQQVDSGGFRPESLVLGVPDSFLEAEANKAMACFEMERPVRDLSSEGAANVVRRFPCPGRPTWRPIEAGAKEIWEPANTAIEDAYLKTKGAHRDAIFFGSQFVTGRDVLLPKGARNKSFGNELLRQMRGIQAQNRPDIIDFEERVFYEIKTAKSANKEPGKVKDQLLDYYRKAEAIRKQFGVASEPEWANYNATWTPPHQLPFGGDVLKKFVCTAATDYSKWPNGLLLYEVWEKDEEAEKKRQELLKQLALQLQALRHAYELYSNEHRAQLGLFNNTLAGFATNTLFNRRPPEMVIWNNAYGRILATQRHINDGNVAAAAIELSLARAWYVFALYKYITFKEGIQKAGNMAQAAIVATAVVVVVAAAAAAAVTAMGSIAATTGEATVAGATTTVAVDTAQGGQLMVRIADGCEKMVRVVANEPEFLRGMEEVGKIGEKAMRMLPPP